MSKYIRSIKCVLTVLALLVIAAPFSSHVHADSFAANTIVEASCMSLVEGTSRKTLTVTSGAEVNITIANQDPVVAQSVSGPGIPTGVQLQKNAKESTNATRTFLFGNVTSAITISLTPVPADASSASFVNNCPTGSNPVASTIVINPETAAPSPAAPTASIPKKATTTPTPAPPTPAATTPATDANVAPQQTEKDISVTPVATTSAKTSSKPNFVVLTILLLATAGVVFAGLSGKLSIHKRMKRLIRRR